MRLLAICLLMFAVAGSCCRRVAADDAAPPGGAVAADKSDDGAVVERRLYAGEVVKLAPLLERKGIRVAAEMRDHVVLQMDDGRVLPILADWRGRAFYQDERLRDRPVTLVASLRPDVGYLQVLMVYTHDKEGRPLFTDYWCDICSIPMYELKPCECCQGEIRLREEPRELPEGTLPEGMGP